MSFRFFPPGAQLFTNDGLVLAAGSLTFTDSGTTTPRTTWSDPAMTTPNPNPVPLDGAGRPNVDIWGDGVYRVTIKNSLGATVGAPLDNVSGPVGIPSPTLQSGKFLTNDGTNVSWAVIRQVPNPTGQPDGHVLTTDGAGNTAWEVIPTTRQVPDPAAITDGWVLTRDDASPGDYAWKAPASGIDDQDLISNGFVKLNGGFVLQWGTSGAVGAGGTLVVTFPEVFANACFVALITGASPAGTAQSADYTDNLVIASFTIHNAASVSRSFRWIALGN